MSFSDPSFLTDSDEIFSAPTFIVKTPSYEEDPVSSLLNATKSHIAKDFKSLSIAQLKEMFKSVQAFHHQQKKSH